MQTYKVTDIRTDEVEYVEADFFKIMDNMILFISLSPNNEKHKCRTIAMFPVETTKIIEYHGD